MNNLEAKKYYNKLAEKYDQVTTNIWTAPEHIENITQTITNKETTILDIGIGTGQCIDSLYKSQNFASIEGIDVSDKMLNYCSEKYPNIKLHLGDFLNYNSFNQTNYNLIICCGCIEFMEDLELFFQKCKTLISTNGHLVLTFEPIISRHLIQKDSISEVSVKRSSGFSSFMTHRHELDKFHNIAEKNNFKIIEEKIFVAYKKIDVDVIYILVNMIHR